MYTIIQNTEKIKPSPKRFTVDSGRVEFFRKMRRNSKNYLPAPAFNEWKTTEIENPKLGKCFILSFQLTIIQYQ